MSSLRTMALFKDVPAQAFGCHADAVVCSGTSCLESPSSAKSLYMQIATVLIPIILGFIMFSMGCTVELPKLLGHLRRPWGISIGFLCQFGFMPLIGFALAMAFNVAPLYAVVVIILGCCPGGSTSNVVTYILNGDMDLSISMTTCSTVLAMGMMPLCMLIYTSLWVSASTIQIPYVRIVVSLITLTIPIALGMYVRHKWLRASEKITKVGTVLGFFLLLLIALSGAFLYKDSWNMEPKIWAIGALFPFLGYSLGFLMALLVGQPWYRCRTIGLETGFQNVQLCSAIVQLSFSQAEIEIIFVFPLVYVIFQVGLVVLTIGGYYIYIYAYRGGRFRGSDSSLEDGETGKQKKYALENSGFEHSDDSLEKSQDHDTNTHF